MGHDRGLEMLDGANYFGRSFRGDRSETGARLNSCEVSLSRRVFEKNRGEGRRREKSDRFSRARRKKGSER